MGLTVWFYDVLCALIYGKHAKMNQNDVVWLIDANFVLYCWFFEVFIMDIMKQRGGMSPSKEKKAHDSSKPAFRLRFEDATYIH